MIKIQVLLFFLAAIDSGLSRIVTERVLGENDDKPKCDLPIDIFDRDSEVNFSTEAAKLFAQFQISFESDEDEPEKFDMSDVIQKFFVEDFEELLGVKKISEEEARRKIEKLNEEFFNSEDPSDLKGLFRKIFTVIRGYSLNQVLTESEVKTDLFDIPNQSVKNYAQSLTVQKGEEYSESHNQLKRQYVDKLTNGFFKNINRLVLMRTNCMNDFMKKLFKELDELPRLMEEGIITLDSDTQVKYFEAVTDFLMVLPDTSFFKKACELIALLLKKKFSNPEHGAQAFAFIKLTFKSIFETLNEDKETNEELLLISANAFYTKYVSFLLRFPLEGEEKEKISDYLNEMLGSYELLKEEENQTRDFFLIAQALNAEIGIPKDILLQLSEKFDEFVQLSSTSVSHYIDFKDLFSADAYTFKGSFDIELAHEAYAIFAGSLVEHGSETGLNDLFNEMDKSIERFKTSADKKFIYKIMLGLLSASKRNDLEGSINFPAHVDEKQRERIASEWNIPYVLPLKQLLQALKNDKHVINYIFFYELFDHSAEGVQMKVDEIDSPLLRDRKGAEIKKRNSDVKIETHELTRHLFYLQPNCDVIEKTETEIVGILETELEAKHFCAGENGHKECSKEQQELEKAKCLEKKYAVKENIIHILKGELNPQMLDELKKSDDIIDYIKREGVVETEINGVTHEYVFVEVDPKTSPCYHHEF